MDTSLTLTNEMKLFYDKVFLARANKILVMQEGSQKRSIGQNEGKSIVFNRYSPLTVVSTALTEGENPVASSITGAAVSATLGEHGFSIKMSKFLSLTSIDVNNREKISLLGKNMGDTLDLLTREQALENGTVHIGSGATSIAASSVSASDVVTAAGIRRIVEKLETNGASAYEDGCFMGKFTPKTKTSIVLDTTWINSKVYKDSKALYNGEMGELYQVRCLLGTQGKTSLGSGAASTVTLYHNYIHGAEAFGTYDLSGDQPKLHIYTGAIDSSNPTGRFSIASWAGSFVAKDLNTDWMYVWKTAA